MGGMNTSTPIISNDTLIYSGSGRGVQTVKFEKDGDALKATELWSNKDNSIQYNSPILKELVSVPTSGESSESARHLSELFAFNRQEKIKIVFRFRI